MNDQGHRSGRDALAELSALVAEQISERADDEKILQHLESEGISRETGKALIERIRHEFKAERSAVFEDLPDFESEPLSEVESIAGLTTQPVGEVQPDGEDATVQVNREELVARLQASAADSLETEISAVQSVPASILLAAIAGGALAAVAGGLVWGVVVGMTGWEIGYMAWGMGALAGFSILFFAKGHRGKPLQVVAVASAFLGILIGKYFTFYYVLQEWVVQEEGIDAAAQVSFLSTNVILFFVDNVGVMLSSFDLLWVFLAVGTAWGIPKAGAIEAT